MLSRAASVLGEVPGLRISTDVPLSRLTRFGIGGPARILADAETEFGLVEAVSIIRRSGVKFTVIGGGTNLVANDAGFDGIVLRYTNSSIEVQDACVRVAAGAVLQNLVDRSIEAGLRGLETMTGIPGWVGGAIYGNAGAYGHSIDERVRGVRYFDTSENSVDDLPGRSCQFHYRESIFKRDKHRIVLSAHLELEPADPAELKSKAEGILKIRNEKYPPSMLCAGSIFKNLMFADLPPAVQAGLPERVIREGKVPSAYFLEQAGAKGIVNGGAQVAEYHANLIYNTGSATANQIRELIADLKRRVQDKFGILLEEEVQFI